MFFSDGFYKNTNVIKRLSLKKITTSTIFRDVQTIIHSKNVGRKKIKFCNKFTFLFGSIWRLIFFPYKMSVSLSAIKMTTVMYLKFVLLKL